MKDSKLKFKNLRFNKDAKAVKGNSNVEFLFHSIEDGENILNYEMKNNCVTRELVEEKHMISEKDGLISIVKKNANT